jgi:hypothetical protein
VFSCEVRTEFLYIIFNAFRLQRVKPKLPTLSVCILATGNTETSLLYFIYVLPVCIDILLQTLVISH